MFSLRIFGAPVMTQTGHNKNQSITASAHLLSGAKQKIYGFEMVRLFDKEKKMATCLSQCSCVFIITIKTRYTVRDGFGFFT